MKDKAITVKDKDQRAILIVERKSKCDRTEVELYAKVLDAGLDIELDKITTKAIKNKDNVNTMEEYTDPTVVWSLMNSNNKQGNIHFVTEFKYEVVSAPEMFTQQVKYFENFLPGSDHDVIVNIHHSDDYSIELVVIADDKNK